MTDRKLTVILALTAGLPNLAHAQMRFGLPAAPGTPVLLGPVLGPAMTLSPTVAPLSGLPGVAPLSLGTPLTLNPVAGLTPARAIAAPAASAEAGALATGGAEVRKATSRGNLQALAASVAPKGKAAGTAKAMDALRAGFDAGRAAEPGGVSWFGGEIDPRIARAVQTMGGSAVGLSIYQEIYKNYGSTLRLETDRDPSANYDARLTWRGDQPVIQVTETLLNRESDEFAAAKIARAMAELYYKDFPASAEREYLTHAAMNQTFAELTGSGTRNWWDARKDRWEDGRSHVQAHYGSWKESLQLRKDRRQPVQDSTYFRWLGNGKASLSDLHNRGTISWSTYNQMSRYFDGIIQSQTSWLSNTGRWWSNP